MLNYSSTGDIQTLKGISGSVFAGCLGPGALKVLFEPSECLWLVWDSILNVISPLLLSFWGFSFALGCGVSSFGVIQKHFFKDTKKKQGQNFYLSHGKKFWIRQTLDQISKASFSLFSLFIWK